METRNACDCNGYSVLGKGEKMSPNEAGSVREFIYKYNDSVRSSMRTSDTGSFFSGLMRSAF